MDSNLHWRSLLMFVWGGYGAIYSGQAASLQEGNESCWPAFSHSISWLEMKSLRCFFLYFENCRSTNTHSHQAWQVSNKTPCLLATAVRIISGIGPMQLCENITNYPPSILRYFVPITNLKRLLFFMSLWLLVFSSVPELSCGQHAALIPHPRLCFWEMPEAVQTANILHDTNMQASRGHTQTCKCCYGYWRVT